MKKCKYMTFNFTRKYQFSTRLCLSDRKLDEISECKLLGHVLTSDLSFEQNTDCIIKNAFKRMIMIQKLGHATYILSINKVCCRTVQFHHLRTKQWHRTNPESCTKSYFSRGIHSICPCVKSNWPGLSQNTAVKIMFEIWPKLC